MTQNPQRRSGIASFVWSEVETPFHRHAPRRCAGVLLIESNARELALNGFDEVVTFQGRVQCGSIRVYIGVDEPRWSSLGSTSLPSIYHRYRRDASTATQFH